MVGWLLGRLDYSMKGNGYGGLAQKERLYGYGGLAQKERLYGGELDMCDRSRVSLNDGWWPHEGCSRGLWVSLMGMGQVFLVYQIQGGRHY